MSVKTPRGELGCFATYSHKDANRAGSKVTEAVKNAGLEDFLDAFPESRSATDVFRSACRSVESRRGERDVEIAVDEIVNDANECLYQITRQVRDRTNRVIEPGKSMMLALRKSVHQIEVRQLGDDDALRGLEQAIREHYTANTTTVPGQKIRNGIIEVLARIGAQNVAKRKGLYFVPEQYKARDSGRLRKTEPVLQGLANLIDELYGQDGDLFWIPCPDTDYLRRVVARHFVMNTRKESAEALERALYRLRQGAGDRGLRGDFMAGLVAEDQRLRFALDQFDQIVGVERDEIEANLNDLEKAIADLEQLRSTNGN